MHIAPFISGTHRWVVPAALAVVVPLLFAARPGTPVPTLATEPGAAMNLHADAAALKAVRSGFLEARMAEREVIPGRPSQGHADAVAAIRRTIDTMRNAEGSADENARGLRAALETYAQAFAPETGGQFSTGFAAASGSEINALLGQLQASDEAFLREPIMGMRLAEAALLSDTDPWSSAQLSRWADVLASRLEEMAIPDGTRTRLTRALAVNEHSRFGMNNAVLEARRDVERTRAAATHAMEAAIAKADLAVTTGQQRMSDAFDAARDRLWWFLGAAVGVLVLAMSGAGFAYGRAAAWHEAERLGELHRA